MPRSYAVSRNSAPPRSSTPDKGHSLSDPRQYLCHDCPDSASSDSQYRAYKSEGMGGGEGVVVPANITYRILLESNRRDNHPMKMSGFLGGDEDGPSRGGVPLHAITMKDEAKDLSDRVRKMSIHPSKVERTGNKVVA